MQDAFAPHREDFERWKKAGCPNVRNKTRDFIENLPTRVLWPHQLEAILRTIYSFEVLQKKSCLLNIVTGGGKTAIIAAVVFWLKYAHNINKFLVISPNTVVRDRLEPDFAEGHVFKKFKIVPSHASNTLHELASHVMKRDNVPQGMLESGIIIANIQQLYSPNGPSRNMAYLHENIDDIAVFNDEAHNTPAPEYTRVLNKLSSKCRFRLDTTATPERADGARPDSEMIYYYGIADALRDNIIKSVVVYQPDIELIRLTYTNPGTGEKRDITELDAEFEEAEKTLAPFRWILDLEPMKKQVEIALRLHREQVERARGKHKPVLFVVTMSIHEGERVRRILQEEFGIAALLVTEKSSETERAEALRIGTPESRYGGIVSVLMLREGWDVPEVSTILLLRKFTSPVYGQQVIGRGLRKITKRPDLREALLVADHPKLGHSWLWELMGVSKIHPVTDNEGIADPMGDSPDPPIQYCVNPDKHIRIPPCSVPVLPNGDTDRIPNDAVEHNWEGVLASITYDRTRPTITQTRIKSVRSENLRTHRYEVHEDPTGNTGRGHTEDVPTASTKNNLEPRLKEVVLEKARSLLDEAGFSRSNVGLLNRIMLAHIQDRVLGGKRPADASHDDMVFAIERIEDIAASFTVPIVAGIVEGGQ